MSIGEQRLSVIVNSPLFQEELRVRLLAQEEEILKRLCEQDRERIELTRQLPALDSGVKEVKASTIHVSSKGVKERIKFDTPCSRIATLAYFLALQKYDFH
jgi:hypothetical protein